MWKLRKINSYQLVIHSLLVMLGILVWVLANQNENPKQQLRNSAEKIFLKVGEQIENFEVYDLHGNKQLFITNDTLNLKEKLLFFFTADCSFCTKNIENWKLIFDRFNSQFQIYGIGMGKPQEIRNYRENNSLPYNIMIPTATDFRKKHRIAGVPMTILLSNTGAVKNVWIGVIDTDEVGNILNNNTH